MPACKSKHVALRFDVVSTAPRPPRKRPGGALVLDAHISRTGVQTYRNADGTERREYRPDSEVFDPESMASFEMLPLTDEHPEGGEVTAENAKEVTVGATGDTLRRDGSHLGTTIVVLDAKAVKKVEQGKRQLSCGYNCDIDETPGIAPDGTSYHVVQRKIRGNHVAMVDAGRAGTARFRIDRADAATQVVLDAADTGAAMTLEEALKQLGAEKARADAAEKRCATLEGERDSAIAANTNRTDSAEFQARVKARVELETGCRMVLDAKEHDGIPAKTDVELMTAVVKRVDGDEAAAKVAGKSVDYLRARFDGAMERADKAVVATAGVRQAIQQNREDGIQPDAALDERAARKRMEQRSREAGTKPLTGGN